MVIDSKIRIFSLRARKSLAAVLAAAAFALGGCSTTLSQFEPAREVTCVEAAKVSLREAVEAAEKQGGHVIDIHYHQDDELGCLLNKPGYYDVTLLDRGSLVSLSVDVRSKVIAAKPAATNLWETSGRYLNKIFADDPKERGRIASTMAPEMLDAIAKAEKSGGKALKAYIDTRNGKPGYVVKVVEHGGKVRTTWIDGGQLFVSAAAALPPSEISCTD